MAGSLSRILLLAAACLAAACAPARPRLTVFSAGVLAARLANERCRSEFGQAPFVSDDFDAVFERGRWHWGGPDENAVDGFKPEVSFDAYGKAADVAVTGMVDR